MQKPSPRAPAARADDGDGRRRHRLRHRRGSNVAVRAAARPRARRGLEEATATQVTPAARSTARDGRSRSAGDASASRAADVAPTASTTASASIGASSCPTTATDRGAVAAGDAGDARAAAELDVAACLELRLPRQKDGRSEAAAAPADVEGAAALQREHVEARERGGRRDVVARPHWQHVEQRRHHVLVERVAAAAARNEELFGGHVVVPRPRLGVLLPKVGPRAEQADRGRAVERRQPRRRAKVGEKRGVQRRRQQLRHALEQRGGCERWERARRRGRAGVVDGEHRRRRHLAAARREEH